MKQGWTTEEDNDFLPDRDQLARELLFRMDNPDDGSN